MTDKESFLQDLKELLSKHDAVLYAKIDTYTVDDDDIDIWVELNSNGTVDKRESINLGNNIFWKIHK